jgi:hypothetical protein
MEDVQELQRLRINQNQRLKGSVAAEPNLLLEDEEDGVGQLPVFEQIVEDVQRLTARWPGLSFE